MKRSQGYNNAATEAEAPPPPSTACCAHGCTMPAGIIRDGQRFCCVHLDVQSWDNFGAATTEIRKRTGLVEAINLLRAPGTFSERKVMKEARALWPELSSDAPHSYALLLEAEARMRQACLTGGDAAHHRSAGTPSLAQRLKDVVRAKRMPV